MGGAGGILTYRRNAETYTCPLYIYIPYYVPLLHAICHKYGLLHILSLFYSWLSLAKTPTSLPYMAAGYPNCKPLVNQVWCYNNNSHNFLHVLHTQPSRRTQTRFYSWQTRFYSCCCVLFLYTLFSSTYISFRFPLASVSFV